MINWKVLKDSQLEYLDLAKSRDDEVILVDPTASPFGITFMLFEADTVFSVKQLSRFKNVNQEELQTIDHKLVKYGMVMSEEEEEDED